MYSTREIYCQVSSCHYLHDKLILSSTQVVFWLKQQGQNDKTQSAQEPKLYRRALTKTAISGIFSIPTSPTGGGGHREFKLNRELKQNLFVTSEEILMVNLHTGVKRSFDSVANGGRATGVKSHTGVKRTGVKNLETGVKRGEWLIDTGVKDLA